MAEVEITQEEVRGIDLNQVVSMQLKDGTVVVVQGEGEGEGQPEETLYERQFILEEGEEYKDQSNQLRARPMMGRMVVPPPPHHPKVVRPVPVKPMVVPRGPVRPGVPMGYGVPFRARPGMHVPKPYPPKPMVVPVRPGMPKPVPVARPVVAPKPGLPLRPAVAPVRPMVPGKKPLVAQMVTAPVFRARPGELEEEDDYQEEEYAEEGYYEDEEAEEGAETQLRARPMFAPVPPRPQMVMRPKVVPVPVVPVGPKPVMMPKRGPVPVPGYNTFQPKVFRARPRPMPMVKPMPVAPMHIPHKGRPPLVPPPKQYAYGFGPVFRSRPRSASYDANEYADENEYQYTEGCESSVCTKCGKEF